MENTKENNPHAFPMISAQGEYSQEGMTLRDYFANSAINTILRDWTCFELADEKKAPIEIIVKASYRVADAMLKQREI